MAIELSAEETDYPVTQQALASWRAALVAMRDDERRRAVGLSPETGRMLEIVGQVLAQGGGELPAATIAQIESLTAIRAQGNTVG